MSKQVGVFRTSTTITNAAPSFVSPSNGGWEPNTSEFRGTLICTAAGYYRNLVVKVSTTPSGGDSWVYTVYLNGAPTALTCTMASGATDVSDLVNYITVAVGDTVSIRVNPLGAPTSTGHQWSMDFESITVGESMYGGSSGGNTVSASRQDGPFSSNSSTFGATSFGQTAPMAGTITRLHAALDGDPTPASYTFTLFKNGTAQDGTGGTPDTRVTIASGSTTGSTSFSLSVTLADTLFMAITLTGVPTAARRVRYATNFISSTGGYSIIGSHPTSFGFSTSVTQYWRLCGQADQASGGATEANAHATVGESDFNIRSMYLRLSGVPGSGNSYAVTLRKNAGGTAATVTISGNAATTGNDGGGNVIAVATGDTVDIECVPTSGPTARNGSWFFVADASAHGEWAPPGSVVQSNQCVTAG